MTLHPVRVEKGTRQLKIMEARVIGVDRNQLLASALSPASRALACLDVDK